ncbi:MAG: hypothetical protein JEZ04_12030 [Spirochaetales bacterium]|nr:hypothetical protein [Spirochaetales bacterium]
MSVFLTFIIAEHNQPILTVLDFETNDVSSSDMNSIIDILSSGLFKTEYFIVIDIAQRETVLNELEFSLSGCTDEACMLEVGKMLSAELIVVGSMSSIGSKIVLSAKMIETETSKTMSTADGIYADMDDLLGNLYHFIDSLSLPYAKNEDIITASDKRTT